MQNNSFVENDAATHSKPAATTPSSGGDRRIAVVLLSGLLFLSLIANVALLSGLIFTARGFDEFGVDGSEIARLDRIFRDAQISGTGDQTAA